MTEIYRNGIFGGLPRAGQVRFTEGQRLSDSVPSGVLRATFPRWLIDEATEATGRRKQWSESCLPPLVPHCVLAMTPFSLGTPGFEEVPRGA